MVKSRNNSTSRGCHASPGGSLEAPWRLSSSPPLHPSGPQVRRRLSEGLLGDGAEVLSRRVADVSLRELKRYTEPVIP